MYRQNYIKYQLYKNKFGFSHKCECNDAVHINFGTVSVLLNRAQVSDFATYIAETLISECDAEDHDARNIYLPTRDFFIMFAMTYNELKWLSEILDQTLLMIEIDEVLTLNDQS